LTVDVQDTCIPLKVGDPVLCVGACWCCCHDELVWQCQYRRI